MILSGREVYEEAERLISDIASAREDSLVLNNPRTALVIVLLPGLRIPRIVMQVCSASRTTITPLVSSS